MQREVLLFAALREAAGSELLTITLDEKSCARDVIDAVGNALPMVASLLPACRVAIDSCYVTPDFVIPDEGEIALIPPVSGG